MVLSSFFVSFFNVVDERSRRRLSFPLQTGALRKKSEKFQVDVCRFLDTGSNVNDFIRFGSEICSLCELSDVSCEWRWTLADGTACVVCENESNFSSIKKFSSVVIFIHFWCWLGSLFLFHFFCVFNFFISFCLLCSNSLDNPEIYELRCYPPFAACISHSVKSDSASETAVFSFFKFRKNWYFTFFFHIASCSTWDKVLKKIQFLRHGMNWLGCCGCRWGKKVFDTHHRGKNWKEMAAAREHWMPLCWTEEGKGEDKNEELDKRVEGSMIYGPSIVAHTSLFYAMLRLAECSARGNNRFNSWNIFHLFFCCLSPLFDSSLASFSLALLASNFLSTLWQRAAANMKWTNWNGWRVRDSSLKLLLFLFK